MEGAEGTSEEKASGLAAGAIEPPPADATKQQGRCLNCGALLAGAYCHACGQSAHVHRSLGAFWHDLAHGVLHFEGKIWRTLPLLVWRPGELTRRYVAGERARFVSPMALFLFSVFLMFAVASSVGGPFNFKTAAETPAEERAKAQREYRQERSEMLAELKKLKAEQARLEAAGQSTTSVAVDIRVAEGAIRLQEKLLGEELGRIGNEEQREGAETKPSDASAGEGKLSIGRTGVPWIDAATAKAEKNPDLLFYKLQNNAYKFSWALIPLSLPLLWLLFLHRRRYRQYKAYDHIVFVTYSIAFMSLGYIVLSLLRPLGLSETIVGLAISIVPPVHMYRQLRGAYLLSRWSALWRTFLLIIFAFISSGLFLGVLMLLGVLG